jgi:hypothetical protein
MLLGPGACLDFRKKVRKELHKKEYNIIIMEDDTETQNETRLDVKLQKIMNRYEPVFIAFFLEEAENMEGVVFEIGCICCKYADKRIVDRLMLLSNKDYDWDKRTPYMNNLIPRVITVEFDESIRHQKASQRIDNFANGYILSDDD